MPEKDYSATPLSRKLGLKPDLRFRILGQAPAGLAASLEPALSETAVAQAEADLTLLFAKDADALRELFAQALASRAAGGAIWIAWPKKSSRVATDVSFETVQGLGPSSGLVDVKVCSVDETWSALKFVERKAR